MDRDARHSTERIKVGVESQNAGHRAQASEKHSRPTLIIVKPEPLCYCKIWSARPAYRPHCSQLELGAEEANVRGGV